jgi:hypothetical protein
MEKQRADLGLKWTYFDDMSRNTKILDMHDYQLFIHRDLLQNHERVCHHRGLCRKGQHRVD